MKYKILFENSAEQDFLNSLTYIVNELHNPIAAKNLHNEVSKTLNNIAEFPNCAPLTKYLKLQPYGIRQITVANYTIFYCPNHERKEILVLYFKYAKMDFSKLKI